MKFQLTSSSALALVSLIGIADAAKHSHGHHHHHEIRDVALEKKSGKCQFPTDAGLVAITPHLDNAGWAMSPDEPCKPGNYCPYACPPGEVSMQWDPKATSYTYPMSMNGGLYCDEDGNIQKPFPDRDYCQSATGVLKAHNKAGKAVSFCQTVLPGNEAMLIPTLVESLADLAVPGTSYWCSTSAQYYINPPGVTAEEGCVWGSSDKPVGNWSPYTAGANTDGNGNTFLKIGWNPIYLEPATPFRNERPDFGVEIVCEGDDCEGLPCKIDPAVNDVNDMTGDDIFAGAGGAKGCVVTIPKGETAHIVVFEKESDGSTSSETIQVPTSSSTSSSTSTSTSTPTPTATSTTETTTTSTPTPTSTSTSTATSTSTSTTHAMSSAVSSTHLPKSSPSLSYTYQPHVLTGSAEVHMASSTSTAAASTSSATGDATITDVSMLSLAFGAMAAMVANF